MKKVLHITHTDIKSDSRILKELKSLAETGLNSVKGIGIFGSEAGSMVTSDKLLDPNLSNINLISRKLVWLPKIFHHTILIIEATFKLVFAGMKYKPDIIHCHDTVCLPSAVLIKIICGCKLVYDAHELESDKNGQSLLLKKGTLLLEKLCWTKVDLLVTVSDSIIDWYNQALGKKNSVLVLNAPQIDDVSNDANKEDISPQYLRNLYDIADGKTIFIYVGILAKGRGLKLCLEVFASPSIDAHLIFLGDGELADTIKSYSKDYENIHYHPSVVHHQVVPIVSSADVGLCLIEDVSLSDHFCLPNKLFEYAFAGIYILGSRLPDIELLIKQYSLGKCCDLDFSSIQKAVQDFSDKKGISHVSTDLSPLTWQHQAEKLIQAYSLL